MLEVKYTLGFTRNEGVGLSCFAVSASLLFCIQKYPTSYSS